MLSELSEKQLSSDCNLLKFSETSTKTSALILKKKQEYECQAHRGHVLHLYHCKNEMVKVAITWLPEYQMLFVSTL